MSPVGLTSAIASTPKDGAGILVMKKAMDTFKQDGQSMVQLLAASLPHLGKNVDIRA